MKKLLIILFSILISFNSNAKWTKATEDLGDTYYFDYGSIKKNNGNIFVWMLIDQYKPDYSGNFSTKILYEIDCNPPLKGRSLSIIGYSLPMAKGNPNSVDNATGLWNYANNESKKLLNKVCNR